MKIFKFISSSLMVIGFGLTMGSAFVGESLSEAFTIAGIASILVGLLCFGIAKVIIGFLTAKEVIKTGIDIVKGNNETKQAKIYNQQKQEEYVSTKKVCPYCNTSYEGDTDCPNCGGEIK